MFRLVDVRDEAVGNLLAVHLPVLAVLLGATGLVAGHAVEEEERTEEEHVEPRDEVAEAARGSPGGSHDDVHGVVDLARILVPAVDEEGGTGSGGDVLGVLQSAPRQLREGPRTRDV